jgi:hypothetical protein
MALELDRVIACRKDGLVRKSREARKSINHNREMHPEMMRGGHGGTAASWGKQAGPSRTT